MGVVAEELIEKLENYCVVFFHSCSVDHVYVSCFVFEINGIDAFVE